MIINNIKEYILDNEFKMIVKNHKIGVVNYRGVDHFDSNKIILSHKEGKIIIEGSDLVISRLLKDEMLISGTIEMIKMVTYEK